jgi:transporter family-2 protein
MSTAATVLSLVAGVLIAFQVGMNGALQTASRSSLAAAFVNFLVGSLFLGTLALLARAPLPTPSLFAATPLWAWFGGLCGAAYVASAAYAAPKIGATALLILVLIGQSLASLAIDHYGWMGLPVQPITWLKVLGIALLIGGAVLIAR